MVIEKLAKKDALLGLAEAAVVVNQTHIPVKFCNDFQKGRPLLWLMIQGAELEVVNGRPVIHLVDIESVNPEDEQPPATETKDINRETLFDFECVQKDETSNG
jgi:hypothetical protein